jgi:hypothetical protein
VELNVRNDLSKSNIDMGVKRKEVKSSEPETSLAIPDSKVNEKASAQPSPWLRWSTTT